MTVKEFINKMKNSEFVMLVEDGYITGILPTDGDLIRDYLDRKIEGFSRVQTSKDRIVDLGHIIDLEPEMED